MILPLFYKIHDCFAERRDRFEDLCSCVEKQMDYFAQKRDEEFTELMERRTNLQRTRRERVTQIRRKRSNIYKEIAVLNSEASKLRDLLPVVFETSPSHPSPCPQQHWLICYTHLFDLQ